MYKGSVIALFIHPFHPTGNKKTVKRLAVWEIYSNFAPAFRGTCARRHMSNLKFKAKKQNDYCTSKGRREHRKGPQEVQEKVRKDRCCEGTPHTSAVRQAICTEAPEDGTRYLRTEASCNGRVKKVRFFLVVSK